MIPIFIGRVVQVAVAILSVKAMTTLLSPEEVGRTSLALSVSAIFNLALVNPVWMYMFRRVHEWQERGHLRHRVLIGFGAYLGLLALAAPLALLAATWLGWQGLATAPAAAALIPFHMSTMSAAMTVPLLLNLLGHAGTAAALHVGIALMSVCGAAIAVQMGNPSMQGWIGGLASGYGLMLLLGTGIFLLLTRGQLLKPDADGAKDLRAAWGFSSPLMLSVGFFWLQLHGYRFIFEGNLGAHRLGLFFAGYGIGAAVVNTVESVLTQYLQPAFYRQISEGGQLAAPRAWAEYSGKMLPALLLCVVFSGAASPYLAKLLLGPDFQAAAHFALWGAAIEALRASLGAFSLSAHARSETASLLPANVTGALVAISLALILIPRWGEIGVLLAIPTSFFAATLVMAIPRRHDFIPRVGKIEAIATMAGVLLISMLAAALRAGPSRDSAAGALLACSLLGALFGAALVGATVPIALMKGRP